MNVLHSCILMEKLSRQRIENTYITINHNNNALQSYFHQAMESWWYLIIRCIQDDHIVDLMVWHHGPEVYLSLLQRPLGGYVPSAISVTLYNNSIMIHTNSASHKIIVTCLSECQKPYLGFTLCSYFKIIKYLQVQTQHWCSQYSPWVQSWGKLGSTQLQKVKYIFDCYWCLIFKLKVL